MMVARLKRLNFLPEDFFERQAQRRANGFCLFLVFVVIVSVGAAVMITRSELRKASAEHEEVSLRYLRAAKEIEQFRVMRESRVALAQEATLAATLVRGLPGSLVVSSVTNALPPGASLTALSLQTRRGPSTTPTAGPGSGRRLVMDHAELNLEGTARTDAEVEQFIRNLSHGGLFDNVTLNGSEQVMQGDLPLRKFQIDAEVTGTTNWEHSPENMRTVSVELNDE